MYSLISGLPFSAVKISGLPPISAGIAGINVADTRNMADKIILFIKNILPQFKIFHAVITLLSHSSPKPD
jgi:hypothetical protein